MANNRTFDLTIPMTRRHRVIWRFVGAVQILNGFLHINRGDFLLGGLTFFLGLLFLPGGFPIQLLNRYIITFQNENLEIQRGVFEHRVIPWTSLSEIHIRLMAVELILKTNKRVQIQFGDLGYHENQTIKPQILSEFRACAESNRIPVIEQSTQLEPYGMPQRG